MRKTHSPFQPRDPAYAERIRASFALQQAMALVGAQLQTIEPGRVEITLPYKAELTQQHGYIHGGIVGMIADSAAGYAANTLAPAGASVLTVEYKMNLLAPADGERLLARGEVIKPGRQLSITRAEVFSLRGTQQILCAVMQQTMMTMHDRAENGTTPSIT